MHEEDQSRLLVLKSGIPTINQAWMQPYEETIHHDRGDDLVPARDKGFASMNIRLAQEM